MFIKTFNMKIGTWIGSMFISAIQKRCSKHVFTYFGTIALTPCSMIQSTTSMLQHFTSSQEETSTSQAGMEKWDIYALILELVPFIRHSILSKSRVTLLALLKKRNCQNLITSQPKSFWPAVSSRPNQLLIGLFRRILMLKSMDSDSGLDS